MKRENTVKLDLMDIVRDQGHDFMAAAEMVDNCLAEFRQSGKASATYTIGRAQFTLQQRVQS